jgi:ribonuclease HI
MTTHLCKRCGAQHDLFYRVHEGGEKHLLYQCTKTREYFGVERIDGLNIPTVLSKKAKREQAQRNAPESLFDASKVPTLPKPPADYTVTIRFDGGCQGNPGRKYGSYRIEDDLVVIAQESRFDLGTGTNNEAEFEALIRALKTLRETSHRTGVNIATTGVHALTDSTIVRNRLMGKNKVHKKAEWRDRSEAMFNLANQCLELLGGFHSFIVEWNGREGNVEVFGH